MSILVPPAPDELDVDRANAAASSVRRASTRRWRPASVSSTSRGVGEVSLLRNGDEMLELSKFH
jgi:hypothetical protein